MTDTPDLATWISARLDARLAELAEDERVALAAQPGPWERRLDWVVAGNLDDLPDCVAAVGGDSPQEVADGEHIARNDPASTLRRIEAERRTIAAMRELLTMHEPVRQGMPGAFVTVCLACGLQPPCPTVRLLALPYADRPDYRDEWRP